MNRNQAQRHNTGGFWSRNRITACRLLVAAGVLCLAPVLPAEESQKRLKVYPVLSPDAGPVIETVRSLLVRNESVIHDARLSRLLVIAGEETHAKIAAMMEAVDRPGPNVQIALQVRERAAATHAGAGAGMDGDVVIRPGRLDADLRLKSSLRRSRSSFSADMQKTLVVQSGHEAVLRVGESVPYIDWIIQYGSDHGHITAVPRFETAGAFLRIMPTVIGEGPMLRLVITPELRGRADGNNRTLAFADLTTAVTIRNGQTVVLGSLDQHSEFMHRFLVGRDSEGREQLLEILACPTILAPVSRPEE